MAIPDPALESSIDFRGWQTWYRITGDIAATVDAGKAPLVILHGGPGACHNYTLRIARLAEQGRAVIHYDQLGCGLSTHLPERGADFWTVQLFLDELDNLLRTLGIADNYAILGQSWGGMLAAEHAVLRPSGLSSLVIANSPASMQLWVSEANRLRANLPPDIQATLSAHEAAGTTQSPEYLDAVTVFYDKHVCRIVPNPDEVTASFASLEAEPTVYHTMNGPNEFHVIGSLRDWTIVDRLSLIETPTLLINGAYDEATPATVQPFADHIANVRWEVFAESSHMPHVEEEERYLSVVSAFLDEHDGDGHRRPEALKSEPAS